MLAALLVLAGCGLFGGHDVADRASPVHWRSLATQEDRQRLQGWRPLWQEAVRAARSRGFAQAIAREGLLLHPDAGHADPAPPVGAYRCRLIRLGGAPAYQVHPPVACRVTAEGGALSFAVTGGMQRPAGRIYPDDIGRRIFIGAVSVGDERRTPVYGADRTRDMIGHFEALPPDRWRLVLPRPRWGADIDLIEIRPVR